MADEVIWVVAEKKTQRVRMTREAMERRDHLLSAHKCLGCEKLLEDEERETCGLCRTCYPSARYFIRKGTVTEAELIREGRMLPPTKGGNKPANPFTRMLADR